MTRLGEFLPIMYVIVYFCLAFENYRSRRDFCATFLRGKSYVLIL
jgi:hypothetical protein